MALDTKLEFNDDFKRAIDLLELSNKHLFITGNAGTGKSTLLQYFRQSSLKNVAVLAPTGVAAVNVRGQTIHSFFNFKPDITVENVSSIKLRRGQKDIFKKLHTIIIDEISMVRADLLDCIDAFLRKHSLRKDKPFGGVQMVFIGDLYQLPPVLRHSERELFSEHYPSPFFFDAKAFDGLDFEFVELTKIYRQQDKEFIDLLNAVRNNNLKNHHLESLQSRCRQDAYLDDEDDFFIYLTTTNRVADQVNAGQLKRLRGKEIKFEGEIDGKFDERIFPTHFDLTLKVGAQVMMLNNDSLGRWINGSLGRVDEITKDDDGNEMIVVELSDGGWAEVLPYTWESVRYFLDEEDEEIKTEVVGTYKQYPLRLAWALTIHKAQGKTFDKVVIDIGDGAFAHGQTYVALSRCRTLEGITLRRPIYKRHIIMDKRVINFMNSLKSPIPTLR